MLEVHEADRDQCGAEHEDGHDRLRAPELQAEDPEHDGGDQFDHQPAGPLEWGAPPRRIHGWTGTPAQERGGSTCPSTTARSGVRSGVRSMTTLRKAPTGIPATALRAATPGLLMSRPWRRAHAPRRIASPRSAHPVRSRTGTRGRPGARASRARRSVVAPASAAAARSGCHRGVVDEVHDDLCRPKQGRVEGQAAVDAHPERGGVDHEVGPGHVGRRTDPADGVRPGEPPRRPLRRAVHDHDLDAGGRPSARATARPAPPAPSSAQVRPPRLSPSSITSESTRPGPSVLCPDEPVAVTSDAVHRAEVRGDRREIVERGDHGRLVRHRDRQALEVAANPRPRRPRPRLRPPRTRRRSSRARTPRTRR